MEQCFRIALLMVLLTGYLHAHPTAQPAKDCFKMRSLGFNMLHTVSCNNMTFTAPTNVERACYAEALKFFEKGMMVAREEMVARKNNDGLAHIGNTLEALGLSCLKDTQTNCSLTFKVHQEFRSFVNAAEAFVQQVNFDHRSQKQ